MFGDLMFGLFLLLMLFTIPVLWLTRRLRVALAVSGVGLACLMLACAASYEIARITGIAGLLYQ
jgi:hypothetical protein